MLHNKEKQWEKFDGLHNCYILFIYCSEYIESLHKIYIVGELGLLYVQVIFLLLFIMIYKYFFFH